MNCYYCANGVYDDIEPTVEQKHIIIGKFLLLGDDVSVSTCVSCERVINSAVALKLLEFLDNE